MGGKEPRHPSYSDNSAEEIELDRSLKCGRPCCSSYVGQVPNITQDSTAGPSITTVSSIEGEKERVFMILDT
jgi:hypothetical protein